MDEKQIERIASAAAKTAVVEVLTSLGVIVDNPIRTQQDMVALRELGKQLRDPEYQADQLHLRKWRTAMDAATKMSFRTVISVLIVGGLGALWLGIKMLIHKP